MPVQVNNTESMTVHVVVNLTVRNDITKCSLTANSLELMQYKQQVQTT